MIANKRNRSVMKHQFGQVPSVGIARSTFNRSHGRKLAFDSGYLIPILCDEALPGDTFNVRLSSVARLATPSVPFMDNLHLDFFFFAVPNRLLWENWQRFMGERDPDPDSSTDFTCPKTELAAGYAVGSLQDHMGLVPGVTNHSVNAFHTRAYNKIWNQWFRHEFLQDSVHEDFDNGPDDGADYELLRRGKRPDYFTSCLPFPQAGDSIELPLGDSAPVVGDGAKTMGMIDGTNSMGMWLDTNGFIRGAADRYDVALGTAGGTPSNFNKQ